MKILCPVLSLLCIAQSMAASDWPILKRYDQAHLDRIAMPIGGIGTGTISLGGRGDLRDWEIMNRPAKNFIPYSSGAGPFFAIFVETADGKKVTRALEGPIALSAYEGPSGSPLTNHGLARFANCSFAAAYPFGQVFLSDPSVPVDVQLKAFNPFVPGDENASGLPVAVLTYVLHNKTEQAITGSVCGSLPNFIGNDGCSKAPSTGSDRANLNHFRKGEGLQGMFMTSRGIDPNSEQWGTIALVTTEPDVTCRTVWVGDKWMKGVLDFWDDYSNDGKLQERQGPETDCPMASLAANFKLAPSETREVKFLITWHFPNRQTWTPVKDASCEVNCVGNYYTTLYKDAWDAAEKILPGLDALEQKTITFVRAFCESNLPEFVKEAALFNTSTLRTQTCFRTADGRFYGWEGCGNNAGSCYGSCTHVWNYEQATPFLFGSLAKIMRNIEFAHATKEDGKMSFRVKLPIQDAKNYWRAAADGQMGCVMKMYRDWQLSGDDSMLKELWPYVKKSLEFCWIKGGWDGNKDGVMEGCQHNTMDVEYYGPNPQMTIWYLGALRAAEEMARYLGDTEFEQTCRSLFTSGSQWIDENLFNGEYYEHHIMPPKSPEDVAPQLLVKDVDVTKPEYQLGKGCLVDQLVGQYAAHIYGLGYLVKPEHVKQTLNSIMKYNYRQSMYGHFNCARSFAVGDEAALLMASYPGERPEKPFPYFTEVMTGFEYTAAIGMIYEGQMDNGLLCIKNIRDRYDGQKRSPFDEAECGHHYARAMASWAAVLALTGFDYSGVEKEMAFASAEGKFFWSNGYAWGTCLQTKTPKGYHVELSVLYGELALSDFTLRKCGTHKFEEMAKMTAPDKVSFDVVSD